ncbi:MAG: hypothetical protein M1133_10320 [Armatimonadetes bacterium]|nr:hypothetical protein [Armatimonadota bacterium]
MAARPTASALRNIWKAFHQLNPKNVKAERERRVRVALVGPEDAVKDAAQFLIGTDSASYDKAADVLVLLPTPVDDPATQILARCDIILRTGGYDSPFPEIPAERIFAFSTEDERHAAIRDILRSPHLSYAQLPLARALPALRSEAALESIQMVSIENAIFVVSTSLGNIIPNPLQPLAAVAASMGDLIVLTANQLRLLFRLAAIYDRDLGFKQQAPEVMSIVGAAFGWRSIARELVGQIPLGGGVVPKAAIAFAGTWAIGDGVAYYYATGRKLTKEEIKERFDDAFQKGKTTAESLFSKAKETYLKIVHP